MKMGQKKNSVLYSFNVMVPWAQGPQHLESTKVAPSARAGVYAKEYLSGIRPLVSLSSLASSILLLSFCAGLSSTVMLSACSPAVTTD